MICTRGKRQTDEYDSWLAECELENYAEMLRLLLQLLGVQITLLSDLRFSFKQNDAILSVCFPHY